MSGIDITTTAGAALQLLTLFDGVVQTFRVSNLEAVAKDCVMLLTGYDDKGAESSPVNAEGKEIAGESWGMVRELGTVTWYPLGLPTFGDTFAAIAGSVVNFSLGSLAYKDFEIKVVVPSSPETAGTANFGIKVIAKNA